MRKILLLTVVFLGIAFPSCAFMIRGVDRDLSSPSYRIRGADYIPVTLVCDAYGINWNWDPIALTAELNKGGSSLRIKVDEYRVYANGEIIAQEKPVIVHNGTVCVPVDFIKTVFNRFFIASPPDKISQPAVPRPEGNYFRAPYYKIKKIVLDAGHGGYDPGAIGRNGIKEKHINLDIVRKMKALLESDGLEVILTRRDDNFISLGARAVAARRANADLFVSIHSNASRTKRLKGFEVYYLSEQVDDCARARAIAEEARPIFDKDADYIRSDTLDSILWDLELTENRRNSVELAKCILEETGAEKRRLKNARFYVLKGARIPAVLVEVGYITNVEDYAKLAGADYRTEMAKRITKGILEFKKTFEMSDGFTR